MSRKKTEINPKRAERVKTIIELEGIKQTAFAEKIHMTQQNVSRIITGKNALTEETARAIVEAFPDKNYRISWLLGYDDIMTWDDWGSFADNVQDRIADGIWGMIEIHLLTKGMSLRLVKPSGIHVRSFERRHFDCRFNIVDKEGNVIREISLDEMLKFEDDIQEYCDFMTEKHLLK